MEGLTIDIITKALLSLDNRNFNDPRLTDFLSVFNDLDEIKQKVVTKVVLNKELTYTGLLDYIRSKFYIKRQFDDQGDFSVLGFGRDQVSVLTWSDWIEPASIQDADPTPNSEHLETFVNTWCDIKKKNFKQFTQNLNSFL